MEEEILSYEGVEFNLNMLFQWELLKKLLFSIAKKQKDFDEFINNNNNNFNYSNVNYDSNKNLDNFNKNNENETNQNINLNNENNNQENFNNNNNDNDNNNNNNKILENKINNLEKIIKNLEKKINQLTNENKTLSKNFINIEEKQKKDTNELNKRIDSISTQTNFNIISESPKIQTDQNENLKSLKPEENNNNNNNFENLYKRFFFIDDKIKKLEESNSTTNQNLNELNYVQKKHEQNFEEINNRLNQLENNNNNKEEIENLQSNISEIEKTLKNHENRIKTNEENILKLLSNNLEINNIQNENLPSGQFDILLKNIKNLTDRINSIENEINKILEDNKNKNQNIQKIINELNNKANSTEILNINEKIDELENIQNNIRDFVQDQQNQNKKFIKDISMLYKSIENLNGMIFNLQNENTINKNSNNNNNNNINNNDLNTIKLAISNINKNILELQFDCNEFRRNFSEILPILNRLSTIEDLKNLEEVLKALLEEYKLLASRKFADKIETQKNLKLLDTQIKHFINEYIENNNKGDNWLLASKPVGFKCASCERYIGDLNNNRFEYLPWNKYPNRDNVEKPYRMGDGFSKMLKKLNINNNNNNNAFVKEEIVNISLDDYKDDDFNVKSSNSKNIKMTLPKVRLNTQQNSIKNNINSNNNNNKDLLSSNEQFETVVENMSKKEINKSNKMSKSILTEPKVLKIYKKNK